MIYTKTTWNDIPVTAQISKFNTDNNNAEYHVIFEINNTALNARQQYSVIETAVEKLAKSEDFSHTVLVWKRYFVSDAINQAEMIPQKQNCAISVIQQPMLNNTKVAIWAYFVENATVSSSGNTTYMRHGGYNHQYVTQLHSRKNDESTETTDIFNSYTGILKNSGYTLKDNCIRTWIFVHGVDVHYAGMVKERKKFFEQEDLTDRTHYLASTGIEGKYKYPDCLVYMDGYAIENINQEQITYLKGLSHLNPTIEYGVTFERATAVDYGDRRHVLVSGTASIDNKGNIVHPLEIDKQIERTLENINVLLNEGESGMDDIAQMIVYLRDTADYELVSNYMEKHYPQIPKVIVWAPVCRPGWLIEIECIAIKAIEKPEWNKF